MTEKCMNRQTPLLSNCVGHGQQGGREVGVTHGHFVLAAAAVGPLVARSTRRVCRSAATMWSSFGGGQVDSRIRSAPSVSLSGRTALHNPAAAAPPPGAYDPAASVGKQVVSSRRSSPGWTFSSGTRSKVRSSAQNGTPGPGSVTVPDSRVDPRKPTIPSFSLGGRERTASSPAGIAPGARCALRLCLLCLHARTCRASSCPCTAACYVVTRRPPRALLRQALASTRPDQSS